MLSSASVQHHLHWGSVTLLRQPTSVLSFIGVLWYLFSYFFLERSGIFSTLFFPSAFPLPYVFPFFLSLFPYPSFLLPFFPAVLSILHICPFIFFALPVLPSLVICFVCFFYAFPLLLSTEAQTLFIVCCQSTALNCSLCFHKLPIPEKFSSLRGYGTVGWPQAVTTLPRVAARRCILSVQVLISRPLPPSTQNSRGWALLTLSVWWLLHECLTSYWLPLHGMVHAKASYGRVE